MPSLPKITLDDAIAENIAVATAALEKHDATIAEDTVSEENSDIAAAAPKKSGKESPISDTDIKKIASGIRKAKSLEDVDERMAETLFGAEFSEIAAHVVANPPPPEPANQEHVTDATGASPAADFTASSLALVEESPPAPEAPTTEMEKEFLDVYGDNALEVSLESEKPNPGMDLSASQRLATVRALNAETPADAQKPDPAPEADTPEPIEKQINTSMTATLKALSVRPTPANDEDDDDDDNDEDRKRGFFSRFRRS